MPNPLIPQGNLNRLQASVVVVDFPQLNITASFLGRMGIHLSFDGEDVQSLPTMTGIVQSPEPFVMSTCTAHLVKSAGLAALYEAQRLLNAVIGDITIRADTTQLLYQVSNCAIQQVRELSFAGDDPDYAVTIRGVYYLNNSLWDS